jgi:outer membrane protein OmpA-like peptidoglycan-associated protein
MLYRIKRFFILMILSLSITLLASCAPAPVAPPSDLPVRLEVAIPMLANNLLMQVKNRQGMFSGQKQIVLEPFIDMKSHNVVKVSRKIEQMIFAETQQNFGDKFTIERLTSGNHTQADYVMHGVILYDTYRKNQGNFYHAESFVVERNTGKMIAKSDVWISNKNLDYTTPIDNSPVVIQSPQSIAESAVGMAVDAEIPGYGSVLGADALMTQAETAYENQDYQGALRLFTQVTQQQTLEKKKMMKTYVGLYRTNIHLGNWKAAEEAFGKLVALSVEEYNTLSVKFLFLVSKTDFDSKLKAEYPIWLRQIGQYFNNHDLCLHIVGHSSRTGKLGYNCGLSLDRAQAIQQKLQTYFPGVRKNAKTDGKAWIQNIVGSGTDDAQDAVDRRVEFKVASCPVFDNQSRDEKIRNCVNTASRSDSKTSNTIFSR